jgi:membrane-bound ClpP family serine protease
MPALAIILVIVGLVLLFLGVFVEAVKFLLWIGVVILVVGIIVAVLRAIRRKV